MIYGAYFKNKEIIQRKFPKEYETADALIIKLENKNLALKQENY